MPKENFIFWKMPPWCPKGSKTNSQCRVIAVRKWFGFFFIDYWSRQQKIKPIVNLLLFVSCLIYTIWSQYWLFLLSGHRLFFKKWMVNTFKKGLERCKCLWCGHLCYFAITGKMTVLQLPPVWSLCRITWSVIDKCQLCFVHEEFLLWNIALWAQDGVN